MTRSRLSVRGDNKYDVTICGCGDLIGASLLKLDANRRRRFTGLISSFLPSSSSLFMLDSGEYELNVVTGSIESCPCFVQRLFFTVNFLLLLASICTDPFSS